MTIFYRHDIIYQHLTTGWETEEEVAVLDEEPREYGTPVVRRTPVFYSDLNNPVPAEIALEEPGWDQAVLPPVVPPVKVPPSTSVGDLFELEPDVEPRQYDTPVIRRIPVFYSDLNNPVPDEIDQEPGWDQAFLPPLVVHPPVFFPRTEEVLDDIALEEPGWDQAPPPPVVLRKPVFYGDWVIGEEIPLQEPGWDQAFLPPLVVHPPVFYSDLNNPVPVEDPDTGWEEAPPPPVIRRIPVFYSDLNNPVPDEIDQDPGWLQAPEPPVVRRIPVFFSDLNTPVPDDIEIEGGGSVDLQMVFFRHPIIYQHLTTGWDEIALEEPGWDQAPPPPVVLPRKIPPSTSEADLFSVLAVVEESGWNQAYLPPLVVHAPVFYSDWVVGEEIAVEEPGWVQDFLPPLVLPRDSAFFLPSENNPVLGPTTIELTYILDAILGPLAPPGLRLKELRLKELRLKELRRRFVRRD